MILISFVAQNFNPLTNMKSSRTSLLSNNYQSSLLMLYSKLYIYNNYGVSNQSYRWNIQSLYVPNQVLILNKLLNILATNRRVHSKLRNNLDLSYIRYDLNYATRSLKSLSIELHEVKAKKISSLPTHDTYYNFIVLLCLLYLVPNSRISTLGYVPRAQLLWSTNCFWSNPYANSYYLKLYNV